MSYWRLYHHFTRATKGRDPLLTNDVARALHRAIQAKARQLGVRVYTVGGVADCVHVAASVPPRLAFDLARLVKGVSSHLGNSELNLATRFAWQPGFGVVSFGRKQLGMVMAYVRHQAAHHADGSTIDFLERAEESAPSAGH